MKYTIFIDQVKALEWGLNTNQAIVFSWLQTVPSWAERCTLEGADYYHASKNLAIEELPIITTKRDTIYRIYKALSDKELIAVQKVNGKDFIRITKKGQAWNRSDIRGVGNKSEQVRNKSEQTSEINPTYKNTNTISKQEKDYSGQVKKPDLFPDVNPNKKTLFRNSVITQEIFTKKMEEFAELGVDLNYYFAVVGDWSDSKNQKKTSRGWLACARNWIREDARNKKMKLIEGQKQGWLDGAKEFLERN